MKAIQVKYISATNFKGTRLSASDLDHNRVIVSWDDALNHEENYKAAAKALAQKMGWTGKWYGGSLPNADVFVCVDEQSSFEL